MLVGKCATLPGKCAMLPRKINGAPREMNDACRKVYGAPRKVYDTSPKIYDASPKVYDASPKNVECFLQRYSPFCSYYFDEPKQQVRFYNKILAFYRIFKYAVKSQCFTNLNNQY